MVGAAAGGDGERASLREALPLTSRANLVIALLAVTILVDLIAAVVDFGQLSLLQGLRDGERVTFAEATASDDRVGTVGIIQLVLLVITAIAFLLWYSRAYRNVIALGIRDPRYGTRWAVGSWFVPIVNLFRPKTVMNDIYRGSDPEMAYGDPSFASRPVDSLLHWWWGLWIGGNIVARFAATSGDLESATTIDRVINAAKAYVASDLIDAVAATLALLVVKKITDRAELRRYRMTGATEGGAAPPDAAPALAPPST